MKLRPYQENLINDTRSALKKTNRVLIQLSTGGGKTCIAAFMARGIAERDKSLWFMCPRDFLMMQTGQTFDQVGISYGFIASGLPFNIFKQINICSVATVTRRLDRLIPPDVFVWDESKHIAAKSWSKIFEWAPKAIHIGLDATPWRLDGHGLGDYFDEMVTGPSVSWLIENGYLSPYRAYAPSRPDLTGVHTVAGDYNRGELGMVMDQGQIIGDMVRNYRTHADGMLGVFFCVSIQHSQHTAAIFNANGIPALHLDGNSSSHERLSAAKSFARREIKILTSVDIFNEGFDIASQAGMDVSVECVGLARPTQSLSLHLQQVGRSLRKSSGKSNAVIMDFSGNLYRHGLPDDEREWSLDGIDRKSRKNASVVKVSVCKACLGVFKAGTTVCPYCHAERSVDARREVEEIAGQLEEIRRDESEKERIRKWYEEIKNRKCVDCGTSLKYGRERCASCYVKESKRKTAIKEAKREEVRKARTYNDLLKIAKERGYNTGWVNRIIGSRQGKNAIRYGS